MEMVWKMNNYVAHHQVIEPGSVSIEVWSRLTHFFGTVGFDFAAE